MTISKDKTKELVKEHGKTADDTGSTESQISIFSERISNLTAHLKANKKVDYNNLLDVFTSQGVSQGRVDQVVAGALPLLQETKEYRQSLENERERAAYQGIPFDQEAFDKNWAWRAFFSFAWGGSFIRRGF